MREARKKELNKLPQGKWLDRELIVFYKFTHEEREKGRERERAQYTQLKANGIGYSL